MWSQIGSLFLFMALSSASPYQRATTATCQVCQLVMAEAAHQYEMGVTTVSGMQTALDRYCGSLSSSSNTICRDMVDCQYSKIFYDAKAAVPSMQSCYDIGECLDSNIPNPLNLVNWTSLTHDYNVRCMRVAVLVVHDTETGSAQETLDVLVKQGLSVQYIAEKNGSLYQMVYDYNRAWHAGAGSWGTLSDLNTYAVGIEVVNWGNEPFPDVQVRRVAALSKVIMDRWHIPPKNIIAHGDLAPSRKNDVSGYWNWTLFNEVVGIFPGLFISQLSDAEQRRVLQQASSFDASALRTIQQNLSNYGYRGNIDVNGHYDDKTKQVIQVFNRHFCPEVFLKETMNAQNDTVWNPNNQRWYGISQERLQFLLANS